jgi:hypothetical protein
LLQAAHRKRAAVSRRAPVTRAGDPPAKVLVLRPELVLRRRRRRRGFLRRRPVFVFELVRLLADASAGLTAVKKAIDGTSVG